MRRTLSGGAAAVAIAISMLAVAPQALALKVIPISQRYTKGELDKVCAANGGTSYGDAESAYGCTKKNVSVECDKTGKCNAYVNIVASPGTQVSVPDLLQQQSAVLQHGMTTGATAGATAGTANVSQ